MYAYGGRGCGDVLIVGLVNPLVSPTCINAMYCVCGHKQTAHGYIHYMVSKNAHLFIVCMGWHGCVCLGPTVKGKENHVILAQCKPPHAIESMVMHECLDVQLASTPWCRGLSKRVRCSRPRRTEAQGLQRVGSGVMCFRCVMQTLVTGGAGAGSACGVWCVHAGDGLRSGNCGNAVFKGAAARSRRRYWMPCVLQYPSNEGGANAHGSKRAHPHARCVARISRERLTFTLLPTLPLCHTAPRS